MYLSQRFQLKKNFITYKKNLSQKESCLPLQITHTSSHPRAHTHTQKKYSYMRTRAYHHVRKRHLNFCEHNFSVVGSPQINLQSIMRNFIKNKRYIISEHLNAKVFHNKFSFNHQHLTSITNTNRKNFH